jgi:hypothetical protein
MAINTSKTIYALLFVIQYFEKYGQYMGKRRLLPGRRGECAKQSAQQTHPSCRLGGGPAYPLGPPGRIGWSRVGLPPPKYKIKWGACLVVGQGKGVE